MVAHNPFEKSKPLISVVMPVHNAGPHLDASIQSILRQSFEDFEFVIRDDGSTDGSTLALRHWASKDPRIRLFEGPKLGLAGSSNAVVSRALAPIVARMDADDISHPERLERQFRVLCKRPTAVLVGSIYDTIDERGRRVRVPDYWRVARGSCFPPFAHTSIMFRRAAFEQLGGYRAQCEFWEDMDLCLRMAAHGEVVVIARNLVSYRVSNWSSRRVPHDQRRIEDAVDRMYACVDAFSRGENYDSIPAPAAVTPRRIRASTLLSIYSSRIWSGQRPNLLARLLKHPLVQLDRQAIILFAWACVGEARPRLLRWLMHTFIRARNRTVRGTVHQDGVYLWRPLQAGAAVVPSRCTGCAAQAQASATPCASNAAPAAVARTLRVFPRLEL